MTTVDRPSLVAGRLFEREEALAALHGAYSEARAGSGRLMLVSGEAGIGKTALLRSFCDSVRPSSRILLGACDPLFAPRPLGPFTDVAAATGGALARLVEHGARPHDVLAAVLDDLEARSTVLVLEDVHWADEATLDVLRLLGRRIEAVPSLDPLRPEAVVYAQGGGGKLKLAALEYIVFQSAWEEEHGAGADAPSLFGVEFDFTPAGNRYGIPAFYALHAWLFRGNPAGQFTPWNPKVTCPG